MPDVNRNTARAGGVQSLHCDLDLIEAVAAQGGHLTIGKIGAATGLPLPTTHRLLRTLVDRAYMRQMTNRRYALGLRLGPLGMTASSMVGINTEVVSDRLVEPLGVVRSRGYALDEQEHEAGVHCVAAPVGPEPVSWMPL